MTESNIAVIDNGSGSIKCGFAGDNLPRAVFSTLVGRPLLRSGGGRHGAVIGAEASGTPTTKTEQKELKKIMVGDETVGVRHLLDLSMPLRNGTVQKPDDMVLLWDHAVRKKLKADPTQTRLCISETPGLGDPSRATIFELLFEKFQFPSIQSAPCGLLSLYSAGTTTGLAVDCGESTVHCTPVYEGMSMRKASRRMDLGGRNVTEYLLRLLQRRGYDFNRSADFETVKGIKEMFCYAAVDPNLDRKLATETTVLQRSMTLPDNNVISIGSERFEATEALFHPYLIDVDNVGLSEQIWQSIQGCDMDTRKPIFENVVLSGGSTMFPGLPTRIEHDLKELFVTHSAKGDRSRLPRFTLKIKDAPLRRYSVFTGGAAYASMTESQEAYWITKKQYEEGGANAVNAIFGQPS
jgi:actin-related protein 2